MSCYEWERGSVKLPSKAWVAFRKALLAFVMNHEAGVLETAKKIRQAMIDLRKRDKSIKTWKDAWEACSLRERLSESDHGVVADALGMGWDAENKRPKAPLKKNFCKTNGKTRQVELPYAGALISLNDKTRTLNWYVEENNHARDHAHAHPVAVEMIRLLNAVEWTRGSGGEFVGNDEYNRDNYEEGGGGNYVTQSWSQREQRQRRQRAAEAARCRSSYHYGRRWY